MGEPDERGGAARAPEAPGGRPPLFELRDAQVRRTGKTILSVGSFSLAEGESVALLGPNGAGKSTFVQLLTREVLPLHRDEPPVAGGLFGTLGLPLRREVTEGHRRLAADALERLGIADLADRDVMTLSTGQVRRVLVARELVRDPGVLVFDEPCTGLDPEGMYHVREAMATLAAEGRSVVLVTHYPEDIVPAIGRVLLIGSARVVADGPKDELLRDDAMTGLFGVPLAVEERDGWYSLRGVYG